MTPIAQQIFNQIFYETKPQPKTNMKSNPPTKKKKKKKKN
jgi:hypothetical protein